MTSTTEFSDKLVELRAQLKCGFSEIDNVFEDCIRDALHRLSEQGVKDYLEGASLICMIGRGVEPVLQFLEVIPEMAERVGEEVILLISQGVWQASRTPNGVSIPPFMATLGEASRRLSSLELMQQYLEVLFDMMERTTGSIHGHHTTMPSPGLPHLLQQMPYLLNQVSLEGLKNWVDYGVRNYNDHPQRQIDYFTLESADSRAMLQRERHGTLFADNERNLNLYLLALWQDNEYLAPYSTANDEHHRQQPYYDHLGIRIPDVFDDSKNGIKGINRYRAMLAHMAAHRRWSQKIVADNYSPFQRIAIECLEDSRVEYLAAQIYPGLHQLWLALHPVPDEDECKGTGLSCIRHRLAMLSYAIKNPHHGYKNKDILEFTQRFHDLVQTGESSSTEVAKIAVSYIARTRRQVDQAAGVYFDNTEVEYRDDNRHLWVFIEEGDEEEQFETPEDKEFEEIDSLPPRHYPEWDYNTKTYRPDWVSLYEGLHPAGNASEIDNILAKHNTLAKRLMQVLDLLKPQNYVRVRYQEEGSELDLDVAIRSLIDFKSGSTPDPRINMSHKHDNRDIAVTLLIDLSASVNEIPDGCHQSILEISREAVALLAWAIDKLGDPLSIAGFFSNTRHDVRYLHLKGFSERWDDEVKARLAKMEAGFSTRMGAAIRHAGHFLSNQKADKKLLLVLTDGEPADIDVNDEKLLIKDSYKAVSELDQKGIFTHCISLDPKADEYVSDIFGHNYTVIDNIEHLPERLPKLFLALTK